MASPAKLRRKADKRKRTVLTLSQKIEICKRIKAGVKKHELMQEFNVGSSTIYDIKSREDEWLNIVSDGEDAANRYTVRRPKMEELETVLFEWFQLKRSEGHRVTGPMLTEKAKDLYEQMNLNDNCVFSGGWLSRFKNRHRITKIDLKAKSENFIDKIAHRIEDDGDRSLDEASDRDVSAIEDLHNFIKTEMETETETETDDYTVSWDAADLSFTNLITFADTVSCFSSNDLAHLRRLYTTFLEKKNKCAS